MSSNWNQRVHTFWGPLNHRCAHSSEKLTVQGCRQTCVNWTKKMCTHSFPSLCNRYLCECVTDRAAKLAGAGVAALANKINRPKLTVGMDGKLPCGIWLLSQRSSIFRVTLLILIQSTQFLWFLYFPEGLIDLNLMALLNPGFKTISYVGFVWGSAFLSIWAIITAVFLSGLA